MEDSCFQNDLNISGNMIDEEPRPENKDTLPTCEDDKVEPRRHRNVHGTHFTRHFLVPEDYLFRETSLPEELIMPRPPGEVTEDPEHGKLHFGVFGQLTSVATCYKQKENWNGYHFQHTVDRTHFHTFSTFSTFFYHHIHPFYCNINFTYRHLS